MKNNDSANDLQYLERRYVDLKEIVEAVMIYYGFEVLQDNHQMFMIVGELNYLSEILGFEDTNTLMNRVLDNDEDER